MKKIAKNLLFTLMFGMLAFIVVATFTGSEEYGVIMLGLSIVGSIATMLYQSPVALYSAFSWINTNGTFKKLSGDELITLSQEDLAKYLKSLHEFALEESKMAKELSISQKAEMEKMKDELKDLATLKLEFSQLSVEMKGILEDAKKQGDDNSILKFIESAEVIERLTNKTGGFSVLKITPEKLLQQTKTALMTVNGNVIPNVANGFSTLVGNYIDTRIGNTPKPDNFILSLVNVITQAGTENIWWSERQNEDGDAMFIGEGDLKPLINAEWITKKSDIQEVAERWKMSNRLIKHVPSVMNEFRIHANELIEQKIDSEVLTGDGLGDNITGISTVASAFIVPPQLALFYRDANIFDAIVAVATSIRLSNFTPTVVVLNTVWEAKMKGLKNTDGDYIIPPFVMPDGSSIGGLRVVFTNKIDDTKMLIGDLTKFNVVFSENIMFAEGYENDDFSKNLTSFKLEAFLGTYMKATDNGAIVYDDIATILTAIDNPAL